MEKYYLALEYREKVIKHFTLKKLPQLYLMTGLN